MKILNSKLVVGSFISLIIFANQGSAQKTKLKWFGHAAFSITTPKGHQFSRPLERFTDHDFSQ